MTSAQLLLILFAIALVVSAMGFWRVVYFISIGYGLSIATIALVTATVFARRLTVLSLAHLLLLLTYGVRLAGYLIVREQQSKYRGDANRPGAGVALKLIIWLSVSLLYVAMASPAAFHASSVAGKTWSVVTIMGLILAAAGLIFEALADAQKSAFKKINPRDFISAGLYRIVRCPNYLGEILFWLGNGIAGIPFYGTWWQCAIAGTGLICIVLIMFGATRRLEISQDARYGDRPGYQNYVARMPVLFPFIPLYSMKRWPLRFG